MANIQINILGFRGGYSKYNGDKNLCVSKLDLIRSSITVGYSYDRFPSIPIYPYRFFYSLGLIALFDFNSQKLTMKDCFYQIDMSEKNIISYSLGMAFTKLVYEKIFSTPFLLNVDQKVKLGEVVLSSGSTARGDLIGLSTNNHWHVVEAKGRSNRPEKGLMTKAKNQARRIIRINGATPSSNAGCITVLERNGIHLEIMDPDIDPVGMDVSFPKGSNIYKSYYKQIIQWLNFSESSESEILGNKYYTIQIGWMNNMQLRLGLLSRIRLNPNIIIHNELEIIDSKEDYYSLGTDGIIVYLA